MQIYNSLFNDYNSDNYYALTQKKVKKLAIIYKEWHKSKYANVRTCDRF